MDCIDLDLDSVLYLLISSFGRWVASYVDGVAADSDLCAVGFVDGSVDFFEVVGIRGDLVIGDDVLWIWS